MTAIVGLVAFLTGLAAGIPIGWFRHRARAYWARDAIRQLHTDLDRFGGQQ